MGDTLRVKVFFARRRILGELARPGTLFIIPSSDNWNDFHFRSRVELRFRPRDSNEEFKMDAFLGFLDDDEHDSANGIDRLDKILERASTGMLSAEEFKFFTMLPTIEAYREIVRTLGVDSAADVLIAARDLVAVTEFDSADWIEAAVATQIFSLSFVREAEAYFAFKNAGSILRGLQEGELGQSFNTRQRLQHLLKGDVVEYLADEDKGWIVLPPANSRVVPQHALADAVPPARTLLVGVDDPDAIPASPSFKIATIFDSVIFDFFLNPHIRSCACLQTICPLAGDLHDVVCGGGMN